MTATTIYCRYCHQRLFDIVPETKGSIRIKCSRCRKIVQITLPQPPKGYPGCSPLLESVQNRIKTT